MKTSVLLFYILITVKFRGKYHDICPLKCANLHTRDSQIRLFCIFTERELIEFQTISSLCWTAYENHYWFSVWRRVRSSCQQTSS